MLQYTMFAGDPPPGGVPDVPEKQPVNPPPTNPNPAPGPEITPPPSPQGPERNPVPNEVPDHDIQRTPPNPKA